MCCRLLCNRPQNTLTTHVSRGRSNSQYFHKGRTCASILLTTIRTTTEQNNLLAAVMEEESILSPCVSTDSFRGWHARSCAFTLLVNEISETDANRGHNLNTAFAKFDLETMRYLFPNNSYADTCQALWGRRCKTPSLGRLWTYVKRRSDLAKGKVWLTTEQ